MNIAFTTLGCPAWSLETILRRAKQYGYDGIDFRGLEKTLDVTVLPELTTGVAATRRRIEEAGLTVSGFSSSISICNAEKRHEILEEARRTIAAARGVGSQNIRVFGGGDLNRYSRFQLADVGADCTRAILGLDGAADLRWHFETHDNWIAGRDCALLLQRVNHPSFFVLWDMGHTPRVGGEMPRKTFEYVNGRIGYTHIKDSVYEPHHPHAMGDGWRYVPPGTGQVPIGDAVSLLKESGYDGWLVFEHEKRWVPTLPEPEEVFPVFARWARALIAG